MVAPIGLSASYAVSPDDASNNRTTISIESKGSMTPNQMANIIQTQPFYKNYNHTTLDWIKSLSSDYAILPNGADFIDEFY